MSNIPTKGDLANHQATLAYAAAAGQVFADVKFFTDEIIKAMNAGQSSYRDPFKNVKPDVLRRLQAEFGKAGWTVSVSNARTGCTISWS